MINTLVIGDIHGCYAELQELLDQADLNSEDMIIALGDIVDRSPETPEVVEFFRSHLHARSLLGNHERKHIRAARGELQPALSQRISKLQLGEGYSGTLIWLETFPLFMELPDAVLVHGYLEPGVALEAQRERVLCGMMGGDHYLQTNYDRPWYELWDGGKPVIVDHLDHLRMGEPFVYQDRVFGLDTSCVHGGRLTGLVLPEFRFVSVPSRGDHWTVLRQHYRIARTARARTPKARIDFAQPWDEGSERNLEKVLAYVTAENQRLLAQFQDKPEFVKLTARRPSFLHNLANSSCSSAVRMLISATIPRTCGPKQLFNFSIPASVIRTCM